MPSIRHPYSIPLSFGLLLVFGACASAQESGDRTAAEETLAAKYPGAADVHWDRDRNDSHEAHFELNGTKYRADFTEAGVWIETEESLEYEDLPAAVREAFEAEYDEDDVVELERTDNAEKGLFYDVEVDPKGEKKFDIEYRADGTKLE